MAWINDEIRARQPWKLTIAEDIQDDPKLVTPDGRGRRRVRGAVGRPASSAGCGRPSTAADDGSGVADVVAAITGEGRGAPLTRVIYTESHDDVANGRVARAGGDLARRRRRAGGPRSGPRSARRSCSPRPASRCCSRARSCSRTAGSTTRWHSTGRRPARNEGILRLHHDLIALRRDGGGPTRGLRGAHIAILRDRRRRRSSSPTTAGATADRATTWSWSPTSRTR